MAEPHAPALAVATRWIDRLALAAVAALLFDATVRLVPEPLHTLRVRVAAGAEPLVPLMLLLIAITLWWTTRPDPRRPWPRKCLLHPGWVPAAVVGCVLAGLLQNLPNDNPAVLPVAAAAYLLAAWGVADTLGFPGTGLVAKVPAACSGDVPPLLAEATRTPEQNVRALLEDPRRLKAWIESEQPFADGAGDLVGFASPVNRVREGLWNRQTIGLLGPFGSGKSSIVRIAFEGLAAHGHRLVQIDGWSLDPKLAPATVLARGLHELRQDLDVLGFRGLPAKYQAAARGAAPAGLRWLLDLPAADPLVQLRRLNSALVAAGLTLHFEVHDLDRHGGTERPGTRFASLQALLDRLRDDGCDRLNFIVSAESGVLDYSRLCKHIVHVPHISLEVSTRICNVALWSWVEQAVQDGVEVAWADDFLAEAPPVPFRSIPRWSMPLPEGSTMNPVWALHDLLGTPRRLKSVLRTTGQAWERLRGEVDIELLLVMEAVRHAAPDAVEELERAQGPPMKWPDKADFDRLGEELRLRNERFHQLAVDSELTRAALPVLGDLLSGRQTPSLVQRMPIQSPITSIRYWDRLRLTQPIVDAGPSDQLILRALRAACSGDTTELSKVLAGPRAVVHATTPFLHAGAFNLADTYRISGDTLLDVMLDLTTKAAGASGALASLYHSVPAAESLRQAVQMRPPSAVASERFVTGMVSVSCTSSLQLVCDFLYGWPYGMPADATGDRSRRRAFHTYQPDATYGRINVALQEHVDGDANRFCDLLSHLTPDYPSLLRQMVLRDGINDPYDNSDLSHAWGWLADVVDHGLSDGHLPLAHVFAGFAMQQPEGRNQLLRGRGFDAYGPINQRELNRWIPAAAQRKRMRLAAIALLRASQNDGNTPAEWSEHAANQLEKIGAET